MTFIPEVGELLTVQLPGEKIRATVKALSGNDAVIVELTAVPMTKNHQFQKGDVIACRRKTQMFGFGESWEAETPRPQIPPMPKPPQPVEEVKDAASPRVEPKGHFREHRRNDPPRVKAKKSRANRGNRAVKRRQTSKGKPRGLGPA